MGDMNYRINGNIASITAALEQDMYEVLRFNDQFSFEKRVGNVAYNFEEGEISFAPTYKLKHGTDLYTMKRIPGWTDRIIYYAQDPKMIKLKSYDSNNEVKNSDHRPVFA
jgi:hypothetical protein